MPPSHDLLAGYPYTGARLLGKVPPPSLAGARFAVAVDLRLDDRVLHGFGRALD